MVDTLIYLEDAPLAGDTAATGLSKALTPMLEAITGPTTAIAVCQTHAYIAANLHRRFERQWTAPKLDFQLARIARKLPATAGTSAAAWHGASVARRLQRTDVLPMAPVRVWVPVGVDPFTLVRARALARALGSRLSYYLVDDLECHPANQLRAAWVRDVVSSCLAEAASVYAITPGLARMLATRYGCSAKVLPLVASASCAQPTASTGADRPFAFFLGSANHLYASGLRDLMALMAELRRDTGQDLTLRLTCSVSQAKEILGHVPAWVQTGGATDAEVAHLAGRSSFCFLPYSFDDADRHMVTTSFPSKLNDYLAYARAIVVYAPRYSVPAELFNSESVPIVVHDVTSLRQSLSELAAQQANFSTDYRRTRDAHFSPSAALRILREGERVETNSAHAAS